MYFSEGESRIAISECSETYAGSSELGACRIGVTAGKLSRIRFRFVSCMVGFRSLKRTLVDQSLVLSMDCHYSPSRMVNIEQRRLRRLCQWLAMIRITLQQVRTVCLRFVLLSFCHGKLRRPSPLESICSIRYHLWLSLCS